MVKNLVGGSRIYCCNEVATFNAPMQAVKEEKAIKKADADDTVVLKAPKKPGAKSSATLSKETLLRPDDAEDEDPGMQQ